MSDGCWLLELDQSITTQAEDHTSFIGGKPRLPAGTALPLCRLCETPLTFFFQVAFPADHLWNGLSLAVFAGVDCAHKGHTIPPMLDGALQGAAIPQAFLEDYQANFRLFIFETALAHLYHDYQERIRFTPWRLVLIDAKKAYMNRVGSEPAWILGDEAPATYGSSTAMHFLMQLVEDFEYEILEGSPTQRHTFELPGYHPPPIYSLFNANALYFFGTEDRDHPSVYIITQTD